MRRRPAPGVTLLLAAPRTPQPTAAAVPALEIASPGGREVVTESRAIGDVIDGRLCPAPSLAPAGLAAAEAAAADLFPAFAAFCKNADATKDDELRKPLLLALCKLDAHLAAGGGDFLAGDQLSLADCFLVPKLLHLRVAGSHFKGFEVPPQFETLQAYSRCMLEESELLRRTAPVPAMVRWGWANARGDPAEIERAAAEALVAVAVEA